MQIGRLRHRITLQKQVNTINEYGASILSWQNVKTLWAEVKPISGKEYFTAQQTQSEVTTQIWIRYTDNLDPTMRVKFNNQYYEIISIINTQARNTSLQLMCKEKNYERNQS